MKNLLAFIFLLAAVGSLWGQKHSFGVKTGLLWPSFYQEETIVINEGYDLTIHSVFGVQGYFGVYYFRQLQENTYLGVSPIIYGQEYESRYRREEGAFFTLSSNNLIRITNLYVPVLIHFDLGKRREESTGKAEKPVLKNLLKATIIISSKI